MSRCSKFSQNERYFVILISVNCFIVINNSKFSMMKVSFYGLDIFLLSVLTFRCMRDPYDNVLKKKKKKSLVNR